MSGRYDLTLAVQSEADEAISNSPGAGAVVSELGEETDCAFRKHPLAIAERGWTKWHDSIHLSLIDGTDYVRWVGRRSDGHFYQIGRVMRLIRL